MRVGDVSFFAPEIPFAEVDLSGDRLHDQLLARIEGYYLRAADLCVNNSLAFATGLIVVTCIDAMATFAHGPNRKSRRSGEDFRTFACSRLPSFKPYANAELLYQAYRNGLVHEARLKNGAQFALGLDRTLHTDGQFPVIDAEKLLDETRLAVHGLIEELRASKPSRDQLVAYVRRTFAKELGGR